ncbi:hypothetical protein [Streptomyces sp. PSKA30]|uniref:hypothetical protein n=1 Tax=Streptomyces sp. PSKA30 TaxID=2874597 RepID=UPI001CD14F03|nr:hypothetical protein [Streptomyces sp. PSKA30]MBZ9638750.1 hypothetical protein [Streptomyces sp. PSKA30]
MDMRAAGDFADMPSPLEVSPHRLRTGGFQQPDGGTEGAVRRGQVHRRAEPRRHLQVADLRPGGTDEEIRRVGGGSDAQAWTPADALLLRAADELRSRST